MKVFILLGFALFLTLGVIIFGYALQASDYSASNSTGNMTATTNTTLTAYSVNYAWWGGMAMLVTLLAVATVLWQFANPR